MAIVITLPVISQEADPEVPETPATPETEEVTEAPETEAPENTKVTLGENEVLIIEENGDTMRVQLGSRGISIVEGEDGTEVKILEMEEQSKSSGSSESKKKRKKKFKPHWAGLEIGLNNYLTPDFDMTLPADQSYMDLNTGKSWNVNLNIVDYGFGLGTSYVGIATGLGFELMNYNFDGQNGIMKDDVSREIVGYFPDYAGNITKSKMNITYVTAPLLLEFQIPTGNKRIHISGGVVGGIKLWSNTKIKYTVAGEKSKEKAKGDYNLTPLRWGFTARVGYRMLNLYANYYMMPLFKEGQGPELYPFSVGLVIPF